MLNYDLFAEQYDAMVKNGGPRKVYNYIIEELKHETDVKGKQICDLGCGQGELAYQLNHLGATVTGWITVMLYYYLPRILQTR